MRLDHASDGASEPSPRPPGGGLFLSEYARRAVVVLLLTILLATVTCLAWAGINILLETFAGILFAIFLSALSAWVSKHTRLSDGWALTVVVVALLAVAAGLGWLLASRVAAQTTELVHKLPASTKAVQDYLQRYEWGRTLLEQLPEARNAVSGFTGRVAGILGHVENFLVAVLVIFFVGIFGASEPNLYREGFIHLVPPAQRQRLGEALDAVVFNLRWWLLGQVFLMIVIGITTSAGLYFIGVPMALTLGLIAGIMEMVPYIGPWISAVPAALTALMISPQHLVFTLLLYLGLHILEGYVLLPLVQRRSVLLPPALTIVTQFLLGEVLGLVGLFVAAPLTVCAVVLLKMLYVEDTLGDHAVDVPGESGNEVKPERARAG
jgi:predicted PurR-regulated permease PerM